MITMLTGVMRANVIPDKKKKNKKKKESTNKIYVKTLTASFGVRGTEFVIVSNKANNVSSLITLRGKVVANKIDPLASKSDSIQAAKEAVDSEQVTTIPKGRSVTSYINKEEITAPAKVNPAQLIALKNNETMEVAKDTDKIETAKVELTERLKEELYAPDTKEEIESGKTEIPTNGSIVDIKSGIFIPEMEKDLDIGKIDAKTGSFIPTKGITIDEKKGFLLADNSNKQTKEVFEKLKKVVEYKELPHNYIPGHEEATSTEVAMGSFDTRWKLNFNLGPNDFDIKRDDYGDRSNIGGLLMNLDLSRESSISYRLSWIATLGLKAIGLDKGSYDADLPDDQKDEGGGIKLGVGFHYKLGADFSFFTNINIEHFVFPVALMTVSGTVVNMVMAQKNVFVPKLEIGVMAKVSRGWYVRASYCDIFSGDSEDVDLNSGKIITAQLHYQYKSWKKHRAVFTFTRADYRLSNLFDIKQHSLLIGHEYRF